MFEPTEHEVDEDVERSMEMFRRAQVGEVSAVEPIRPERLLLVLDASSQDKTGIVLAGGLQRRFAAALDVMDGRENVTSNALAETVAQTLTGRVVPKLGGDSYAQILEAINQTDCNLVIVPCPFARDLETLGSDSTGTVVDVLLSRSAVPLLIVREDFPPQNPPFAHVLMVLIGDDEAAPLAARWATGLVKTSGNLELLLVLEEEVLQNVRELMRWLEPNVEISPEKLAEALAAFPAATTPRPAEVGGGARFHVSACLAARD